MMEQLSLSSVKMSWTQGGQLRGIKNTGGLRKVTHSPLLDATGLNDVCHPAWAINLTLASSVYCDLGGVHKPVHIDE